MKKLHLIIILHFLRISIHVKTSKSICFLKIFSDESIIHKISGKPIENKKLNELKDECAKILKGIKAKIAGFFANPSQTLEIII